jgi:hypothetical protein
MKRKKALLAVATVAASALLPPQSAFQHLASGECSVIQPRTDFCAGTVRQCANEFKIRSVHTRAAASPRRSSSFPPVACVRLVYLATTQPVAKQKPPT